MRKIYLLESHTKNKDGIKYAHPDMEFITFSLDNDHTFDLDYLWTIFKDNNIKHDMKDKVYFHTIEDLLPKGEEYKERQFKHILSESLIWFYKAGVNAHFEKNPQFNSEAIRKFSKEFAAKGVYGAELTLIFHEVDNYWNEYKFKKEVLELRKQMSSDRGNKLGRQHSKKDEERKSDAMKQIETMLTSKNNYKDYEIIEKTGIKRRTYYKYKKDITEGKKKLAK